MGEPCQLLRNGCNPTRLRGFDTPPIVGALATGGHAVSDADSAFTGKIPALYDQHLGPMLFQPYARDLARRLQGLVAGHVLETAAGTGIVTHALAASLPDAVAITATDLNQPMLDHAAAKPGAARVTWRQADAQALPFAEGSFDAVVCQFGVMFFPEKVEAYREARRVLKPRGHFFFNVWDRISENEFADVVTEALATLFPKDPPRFMARTPHGYHNVEKIREELIAAGFADISIETVDHSSRAASPRDPAIAYCQGTPLRNEIEARDATLLEEATKAAADALARRFGSGPVEGRIRAHVITATG